MNTRRNLLVGAALASLLGGGAYQTLVAPQPHLQSGERLTADQQAEGTGAVLRYQGDGNLVLYGRSGPLWATGTSAAAGYVEMQVDGNLVAYDAAGTPYWATDTHAPGAWAEISAAGVRVKAQATIWSTPDLEEPEPGPTPPPATTPNPMVGLLRIQDRIAYADDTGLVLPTYAHAGDLFSVFVRDDARALAQIDLIAAAGYHGARVWLNLGCGPNTAAGCTHGAYWRGREVGPDITPDYWARLRSFRDAFRARGLRLVASQGDIGQLRDRRDFMQRLRALDNEAHVIDWLDCGNEAWQTGEPDPAKLAQCVGYFGAGAALRTLTDAPIYGSPIPAHQHLDMFSIAPADAFDIHSFRGGHSWDKRRHIWGYTYCGEGCPTLKTGIGSEGPGNGARVSAIENKGELDDEAMALLAVASHLGRQAYVWFSGEGVILDRGLETEAGFASVPRVVALLPRDVYTYQTSHHSGDRFAAVRVLQPTGEVRIDGRQATDGRFAYTIDGPPGRYALRVTQSFVGRLCHPGTGACEDVSRTTGESFPVEFTRGRLFIGRLQ